MRYFFVIFFLLSVNTAVAEDASLIFMGRSKHIIERSDITGYHLNEANIGAGLRFDINKDFSAQFGFYKNSLSTPTKSLWTKYAGVDYSPIKLNESSSCGKITAGVFGGVATGYRLIANNIDIVPIFGLQTAIYCGPVFVRGRLFPSPKVGGVGSIEAGIVVFKW
jgi:hypothetical protein